MKNQEREFLPTSNILDIPITTLCFEKQVKTIINFAKEKKGKHVLTCGLLPLVEIYYNPNLKDIYKTADLVTVNSIPKYLLRLLQFNGSDQYHSDLDLFISLCKESQQQRISICLIGSLRPILDEILDCMDRDFPDLNVVIAEPLPLRPLTPAEDEMLIKKINSSGAGLVFVFQGCPRQERWIAEHRHNINATMIGFGGVSIEYLGIKKRTQRTRIEWLYHLNLKRKRLFNVYYKVIPALVYIFFSQLLLEFNKSSFQSQTIKEKAYKRLPEDWYAELKALELKLVKSGIKQWIVEVVMLRSLLELSKAAFIIYLDNIWLTSTSITKDSDKNG